MRKKIVNNETGRRLYVDGKYDIQTVTEFTMRQEYFYKDSEFKKPYRTRNYAQMEHLFPTTHWNPTGFDVPANFPATRGQGYPGLRSMTYVFGCEGAKIGYTTLNMLNNETQELTIEGAQSFKSFSWTVKGTNADIFDLDTAFQTTDSKGQAKANVFTPKNINNNDSVTIQLIDRDTGEVCDRIVITVRCNGGAWVLQNTDSEEETCPPKSKTTGYRECNLTNILGEWKYIYKTTWQCMCSDPSSGCAECTGLSGYCYAVPNADCDPGYYDLWAVWKQTRENWLWVCP